MNGWNEAIASLPGAQAHVLQTAEWAQNKAQTGWQPYYAAWYPRAGRFQMTAFDPARGQPSAAALVLRRRIVLGGFAARMGVLYAPKGPLLDWANAPLRRTVLDDLKRLEQRQGGIFIKIDPDVPLGTGYPEEPAARPDPCWTEIQADLTARGWRPSQEQIQFANTVLLDLTASDEELLACMKQKTRYNIRLAERKGVHIRAGNLNDLPLLYQMYAETSVRDGFVIRDRAYYLSAWKSFMQAGLAEPLIAEVTAGLRDENGAETGREAIAAVFIFRFARRAWYIYGMSRLAHREKMPNYLLQWEAMRRAKAAGCQVYDLWGAPDELSEQDPLWGVYRFKEGLGGSVMRTMGAWDLPANPLLYKLYTETLPRILDVMRRRGRQKTRQSLGE